MVFSNLKIAGFAVCTGFSVAGMDAAILKTSPRGESCVAPDHQCGGKDYTGPTSCCQTTGNYRCEGENEYWKGCRSYTPPVTKPDWNTKLCGDKPPVRLDETSPWEEDTGSQSCTLPSDRTPWDRDGQEPHMCAGDPSSIVMTSWGQAECLVAHAPQCQIRDLRDVKSITFDFVVAGCEGVWTAPLWATPSAHWDGGASSGELDFLENCNGDDGANPPKDHNSASIQSNFAGGGQQIKWGMSGYDETTGQPVVKRNTAGGADHTQGQFVGKATVSIPPVSENAQITVSVNDKDAIAVKGFSDLLHSGGQAQALYPSNGNPFYGSYAQANAFTYSATPSPFKLVSDIWNGTGGDDGFTACHSKQVGFIEQVCQLAVRNIKITFRENVSADNRFVAENQPGQYTDNTELCEKIFPSK